jgi:hypothetical protein
MRLYVLCATLALSLLCQSILAAEESKAAKKWTDFFIGEWNRTTSVTLDGDTNESKTEWTCKSIGGGIVADGPDSGGGSYVAMMAWDGFDDCLHEFGSSTSGDSWQIHFKLGDGKILKGEATAELKDGRTGSGICQITRTGPNSYDAVFELELNDGSAFRVKDQNKRKRQPSQVKNSERLESMGYFIGTWKAETQDGGVVTWRFSWGRNKSYIKNEIVEKDREGKIKFTHDGRIAWDKNARLVINRCLDGAGNPQNFFWRQENDEGWVTWPVGSQNEWPVVVINDDSWRMGTGDERLVYERVDD